MKKPPVAFSPPNIEAADISAIQKLEQGIADEAQQKRALKWIIHEACKTYDMSYKPGDPHDTAFAEGKRYVGINILRLLDLDAMKQRRGK